MIRTAFQYFIVFVLIINIGLSSVFSSQWILIYLTSALLIIHIVTRKNFNYKILVVIGLWVLINFTARIIIGGGFEVFTVLREGYTFLLLPYLVIQQFGFKFWSKFEKVIYILTFVSLPLFLLNVIFADYFQSLIETFRPFTRGVFHESKTYWSAVIYVHAIENRNFFRNCGFMWEPGAFAMIIIWAIAYNWLTKGIIINRKLGVYTIALITTFSTAGYFALFFLFLANYVKKLNFQNISFIVIISSLFFFYVYNLDFMSGKIDKYMVDVNKNTANYSKGYDAIKLNRLQIALYDVKRVIRYPFGYGSLDRTGLKGKDVVGTNGLSALMRMWGILVFGFMLVLLRRYFFMLNINGLSKQSVYFLVIGFLIMLFSNPISRNIFIYLILMTPLIFYVRKSKNEQQIR